jgi:DNA adenine methylase
VNRPSLRAPFPYFGGKSSVADIIWQRLGNVDNYVEPFFGSGAVMLANPNDYKTETVNDANHYVANFWRAVQANPEKVAKFADWPVNEADLQARHWWLITTGKDRLNTLMMQPNAYCPEVAGVWLWGTCAWIGSGFCSGRGPWQLGASGWGKRGDDEGHAGMGINRKLPHLGSAGRGQFILNWIAALSHRLRDVRVCCGDWSRVTGPSVTHGHGHGITGVFLDPPYSATANRTEGLYATDSLDVAYAVRIWAIEHGDNPLMRICLAGYDGEHAIPDSWEAVEWKARGGFGSQNQDENGLGRLNSAKERLWFSPACIRVEKAQRSLFDLMEAVP